MSVIIHFVTSWLGRKQKVLPGAFQYIVEEVGNETPPSTPPNIRKGSSDDQPKLGGISRWFMS